MSLLNGVLNPSGSTPLIPDDVFQVALAKIQCTPSMAQSDAPCENHLDQGFIDLLKSKKYLSLSVDEIFSRS